MKSKLIALSLLAAAITLTGCKTNNQSNVGPGLLRLGVSTAAGYSLMKNPEAAPGVRAGAAIVCSVANGTNLSPAAIVAALNNGPMDDESVFILNAGIGAYTLIFNGLSDTNNVATIRPYTLAVCDGLNDALLYVPEGVAGGAARLNRIADKAPTPGWPQVKFR